MTLQLHDDTKQHLKRLLAHPPQTLIVSGPAGIGKRSLVLELARQLLAAEPAEHRYFKECNGDEGIDAIRNLRQFMSLKTVGQSRDINRIAFIENAELLSLEAENALLKLLEEPPAGAMMILSTSQPHQLLATIHSRAQMLPKNKPAADLLRDYFVGQGYDAPLVGQALLLGQGLPGTVTALLSNEAGNIVTQAVAQAREILRASGFERLALVDGLAKQKDLAVQTMQMLAQMSEAALRQIAAAPPADANKRIANWQQIMQVAGAAETRLRANGQTKLVLTDCLLSMP